MSGAKQIEEEEAPTTTMPASCRLLAYRAPSAARGAAASVTLPRRLRAAFVGLTDVRAGHGLYIAPHRCNEQPHTPHSPVARLRAMSTTVHHVAQAGFGEGTNELYDRCAEPLFKFPSAVSRRRRRQGTPVLPPRRPRLHPQVHPRAQRTEHRRVCAPWLYAAPALTPRRIGAGTGIFTRALLAHPTFASALAALSAVEPSAGMRAQFTRTITDARVACREGTFDATGAPDASADAVVIAQVRASLIR
jgi:hypothetical protein